jgi:hypothetical protein
MIISEKNLKLLKEAAKAHQKLNRYSAGVKAAGGKDATKKYDELNAEADRLIRKLPKRYRARAVLEMYYQ